MLQTQQENTYNTILLIYTVFPAPSLRDTQSQQSISIDRMKLGVENRAVITATQQAKARKPNSKDFLEHRIGSSLVWAT